MTKKDNTDSKFPEIPNVYPDQSKRLQQRDIFPTRIPSRLLSSSEEALKDEQHGSRGPITNAHGWDDINKAGSSLLDIEERKIGGSQNNTEFEADGTLKMNGTATVWNDINTTAFGLGKGAAAPDQVTILASGNLEGLAFDGNATSESLFGSLEILHDFKLGSDVFFHLHWMPTTANAGNVKWFLDYSMQSPNFAFPAPTTISVVQEASGEAWNHQLISFLGIPVYHIGTQFTFKLYRTPTDAEDTYPNDAVVLSFGLHYEIDTLGSRDIYIK
jgi:hypothetical protein